MSGWDWAWLAWPAVIIAVIAFLHWAGERRARGDALAAAALQPPAAGPPAPPKVRAGQAPCPPGPLPGPGDYGRWLKSIDVFERATVITDWQAETHEVIPVSAEEDEDAV